MNDSLFSTPSRMQLLFCGRASFAEGDTPDSLLSRPLLGGWHPLTPGTERMLCELTAVERHVHDL